MVNWGLDWPVITRYTLSISCPICVNSCAMAWSAVCAHGGAARSGPSGALPAHRRAAGCSRRARHAQPSRRARAAWRAPAAMRSPCSPRGPARQPPAGRRGPRGRRPRRARRPRRRPGRRAAPCAAPAAMARRQAATGLGPRTQCTATPWPALQRAHAPGTQAGAVAHLFILELCCTAGVSLSAVRRACAARRLGARRAASG
jgi:hypothetical protein